MIKYKFRKEILHDLEVHGPYPAHNARWVRAWGLSKGNYHLCCDLIEHAKGYTYYAPANTKAILFRGWVLSRDWFKESH